MATIFAFIEGGEEEYSTSRSCIRDYCVIGALTEAQKPVVGMPYSQQTNWPGSEYRVKNWNFRGTVRAGVLINVMRVIGSTSVSLNVLGTKTAQIDKSITTQMYRPTADDIGARKAVWEDAGYYQLPSHKGPRTYCGHFATHSVACIIGGGAAASYNVDGTDTRQVLPDGTYANLGDYVYNNGSKRLYLAPDELGKLGWLSLPAIYKTAGYADSRQCPWVDKDDHDTCVIALKDIGREMSIIVHRVTYRVSTDQYEMTNAPRDHNNGRVSDWGPLLGKKYGPTCASGHPATSGQWRIAGQDVRGDKDFNGGYLLEVTRTFFRVPYHLTDGIWNPDIYPTWSSDWP